MYTWKKDSHSKYPKRTLYALAIGSLLSATAAFGADDEFENQIIKQYEGSASQELQKEIPLFK